MESAAPRFLMPRTERRPELRPRTTIPCVQMRSVRAHGVERRLYVLVRGGYACQLNRSLAPAVSAARVEATTANWSKGVHLEASNQVAARNNADRWPLPGPIISPATLGDDATETISPPSPGQE